MLQLRGVYVNASTGTMTNVVTYSIALNLAEVCFTRAPSHTIGWVHLYAMKGKPMGYDWYIDMCWVVFVIRHGILYKTFGVLSSYSVHKTCKVCGSYVVIILNWMSILDGYMARFVVMNGYQRVICYDEIGLCAPHLIYIKDSKVNTIGTIHVTI